MKTIEIIKTMTNIQRLRGTRQLFFVYYLIAIICCPAVLSAQNGVTVSGLVLNAGTVTFDVSWDKDSPLMPEVWSDSVWVFVDYNDVGTMKRLPLSLGATLTETSAPGVGKVIEVLGNDQGVWVVGNARSAGSFSATVQLLTATATAAGMCVYASNYPPVGKFIIDGEVTFTGTPNYDLIVKKKGGGTYSLSAGDGSYPLGAEYTLLSFNDKTGAPGIVITHAVYCHPGLIGGKDVFDTDPSCASYVAGVIGGEDSALPGCASYVAGAIGGAGDAEPGCAAYRAGSIGGLSFATSKCETYVAGLVGGADDMKPACASYVAGVIGGNDSALPSCASYVAGAIGAADDAAPGCAAYRAGSIGGLSFVGLLAEPNN
jgi:hypothetical protein